MTDFKDIINDYGFDNIKLAPTIIDFAISGTRCFFDKENGYGNYEDKFTRLIEPSGSNNYSEDELKRLKNSVLGWATEYHKTEFCGQECFIPFNQYSFSNCFLTRVGSNVVLLSIKDYKEISIDLKDLDTSLFTHSFHFNSYFYFFSESTKQKVRFEMWDLFKFFESDVLSLKNEIIDEEAYPFFDYMRICFEEDSASYIMDCKKLSDIEYSISIMGGNEYSRYEEVNFDNGNTGHALVSAGSMNFECIAIFNFSMKKIRIAHQSKKKNR